MKNYFFLTLLIISSCSDIPEDQNFDSAEIIQTVVLPKIINETSGLEILNDIFVTHNDSGGEPSLYFFNLSGEITNSKKLEEESFWEIYNNDWEDITADEDYIYIADTGNNFGTRDNLSIIKVKIADFSVDSKIDNGRNTGVPQLEILNDEIFLVWTVFENGNNQLKTVKLSSKDI